MEQGDTLTFKAEKLTCCTLELHWRYQKKGEEENCYSYKIYQKEGSDNAI